jgi:ADP-heptose:LPS heptosyltransferase
VLQDLGMKILIVRFSSIGDIVLTTPVVRCTKQQLKNVELHYLTKKSFAPILQRNPYIDRIHSLQDDWEMTISELDY